MMKSNQLTQLLLSLKYISNEGLDDDDIQLGVKEFITSISLPHLNNSNSYSFIKDDLIRTRENARNILNIIIVEINSTIKGLGKIQEGFSDLKQFREKYPFYVNSKAPKKALNFFDRLIKDEYTYSEASILLNITRQTMSKYVNDGMYGFKISTKKKVKREQIYTYYLKSILSSKKND